MIFLTGFPGFLGAALLPLLLQRRPQKNAVCIVQPRFMEDARARLAQLTDKHPDLEGRVRLLEGDISASGLGLSESSWITQVNEVFHLAAVYDLAVPRELAYLVNVEGTRNVLDWVSTCPNLGRFHYVSTCYVSGRYCGLFKETDLIKGQRFNNFYEETKYYAEVLVQEARAQGLPTTIYRPAIAVGDSRTGRTQKYDGLYFVTGLVLRQPKWLSCLPMAGDPERTRVNFVPCDFVIEALVGLSGLDHSVGRVYHLADPNPLTVEELIEEMERVMERKIRTVPLPLGLAKWALRNVGLVRSLLQMPAEAVDYFVHPTHYGTDLTTKDLSPLGIVAPRLPEYLDTLVEFQRRHPL